MVLDDQDFSILKCQYVSGYTVLTSAYIALQMLFIISDDVKMMKGFPYTVYTVFLNISILQ